VFSTSRGDEKRLSLSLCPKNGKVKINNEIMIVFDRKCRFDEPVKMRKNGESRLTTNHLNGKAKYTNF
jgi:hypothetical protein